MRAFYLSVSAIHISQAKAALAAGDIERADFNVYMAAFYNDKATAA